MTGGDWPGKSTVRLPVERLDAVVFDLDGVLTDTATVHFRVWRTIFAPLGCPCRVNPTRALAGPEAVLTAGRL